MNAPERIGRHLWVRAIPDAREVTGRPEWEVLAKDETPLAIVEWYPKWRCYVLRANRGTVWSDDCLADVSRWMATRTAFERAKP